VAQHRASVMSELTQQSGSLTRLASDLGQAPKVHLYNTFLGGLRQVQEFWCANYTKIPCFDREIKYFDFVSGHLASAETE
jgi:hypothetical protein